MSKKRLNIAVVGATGAVGREALSVLESREVPVERLEVFASPNSVGEEVLFGNRSVRVREVAPGCFRGIDVAIGTTSADVAREWVPMAVKEGALVIDNSSAFRMDSDVPLVVPEVNADAIDSGRARRIIANPNCSTIQMVVALRPLQWAAGLKRIVVSSYQSTSGTGQKGMEALSQEVLRLYRRGHLAEPAEEDSELEAFVSPYPHQIAFNAIPQIGSFLPDGTTTEELKMIAESRKILALPDLRVSATCVRVPWFACHALSVNVETERPLSPEEARALLAKAPGVELEDDPKHSVYPMPFPHAGSDAVYVGRVRRDGSVENGLNMWIVADNLRKGAALNAVQILEAAMGRLV